MCSLMQSMNYSTFKMSARSFREFFNSTGSPKFAANCFKDKRLSDFCETFLHFDNQDDSLNPYFPKSPQPVFPELFLAIVGFDHKKGSVMEYVYPEFNPSSAEEQKDFGEFLNRLTFLAIPDAAHFLEEDYALLTLNLQSCVYYGVTCFRQVDAETSAESETARHWVQKAVCVVSQAPLFVPILNRLHPTTYVYFNQGNFSDRTVFLLSKGR
eukprot:TRINITY_DN1544_c0_g3_i3.p1 TRINITY_DN1544_c0_g3~~TRINITY_DN1544_c0_g3_i3.p1  ORF type:complete len:212 (+),score=8.11 TRINITY_DN1544_c0_g3_i3:80-715(+)